MDTAQNAALAPYVPRLVVDWGLHHAGERYRVVEGSLLSADISGFTALSERLAAMGKAGAEELTDLLNACFDHMIATAASHGGDVLKFGGDALLIFFQGTDHTAHACAAAVEMRAGIARPLYTSQGGRVRLKMSQGIHSGEFTYFLIDGGHQELIVTGPGATATVECEATANAGEIMLSPPAAKLVDKAWLGEAKPEGTILKRRTIDLAPLAAPGDDTGAVDLARYVAYDQRLQIEAGTRGEHRQVTIGFTKFSHTDHLIEHEGPGEMADRLAALAGAVGRAVIEHGAHWLASDVYPDGGKAILTAGAPSSSGHDEDDMLHTVRSILDADVGLDLRCGVNRGPVYVGDLGSRVRRTFTVMGDAVNLAARLMQKADGGQLIASRAVLERCSTRFATEPLEPFMVKGKSQPIQASAVGAVVDPTRHVEASTTPFVARERELGLLGEALDAARRTEGYAIELVGDAGIGKSRLIAEFCARAPEVPVSTITCGQYLRATPYLAIRPLLRSLAGTEAQADPVTTGAALTALVERAAPQLQPWLPLLAIPFDAEVPPTPESDRIAPEFRRDRLQQALLELLAAVMPETGLLLVEDAHWLDDASHAMLEALVGEGGHHPWLIVLTRRPGPPVLPPESKALELALEPLGADAATALAAAIAEEHDQLSAQEVAALAERAGGNPLFVSELVSAAAAGASSVDELPESIEALMTSRIDTLSPADRLLLRDASVLGSLVDTAVLAEALEDPAIAMPLRWEPLEPFLDWHDERSLRFRHQLFRHSAYEGLSYRRRKQVHGAVGDVLEHRTPDLARVAGLLSMHFDVAEDHGRAWKYSVMAGEDAQRKYANVEAAEFYQRALSNATGDAVVGTEIARVAEALGDVTELVARYDDADGAYGSARKHCTDDIASVRLLYKQGMLRERRGRYTDALRWLGRGLKLAEQGAGGDQTHNLVELRIAYSGVRYRQGRYEECVRWAQAAAEEAERIGARQALAHAYQLIDLALISWPDGPRDHDPDAALRIYEELGDLVGQSNVLTNMGLAAHQAGRWDEAVDLNERARAVSEQAGDVNSVATALCNLGEVLGDQGHLEESRRALSEARRVWRNAHYAVGVAVATLYLGRTELHAERWDEAMALLDEALERCREINAASFVLETQVRRAECLLGLGRVREAIALAEEVARGLTGDDVDPFQQAVLQRILGGARMASGDLAGAAHCFEDALRLARAVGAPAEEANTLLARAELVERQGGSGADDRKQATEIFTRLGVVSHDRQGV